MKKLILITLITISPFLLKADCVWGAKDKTTYKVLSTGYGGKIFFSGGYGSDFIIEIDGFIYENISEIMFLKDDFCSWEDNVIYIDDEVYDVKSVEKI
tara:strand:+ start:151 stop:444 length:294 start_codon:yes stop_codon:yes gene_type:complete